jgi:preprotein translocase subunit SecG
MLTFLTVLYVFVCLFLILVVLLQAGRGGGMGAAFGGSTQTVFGGAGAGNFLTRLTVIMAAAFMMLSATLAYLSSSSDKALEVASEKARLLEEARDVGDAPAAETGTTSGAASEAAATSQPQDAPAAEGLEAEPAAEGALDAPVELAPEAEAAPAEAE